MPSTTAQAARFLCIALVLTNAAVTVSAAEEEDVDRTDFSEAHLQDDTPMKAKDAHSAVSTAWIFPEAPDSKLPVGGTTDLLVALTNAGDKMFNVSHIEGRLVDGAGKLVLALPRFEYGQSLGPLEQRSFRFPIELDAEMALGELTLTAKIYYNTRDKSPFVSLVLDGEAVELVPPLPSADAQIRMVLTGVGIAGVLALGYIVSKALSAPTEGAGGKASPSKAKAKKADSGGNEWLSGTLAGAEKRASKKTKLG